jgi:hypothetical protein
MLVKTLNVRFTIPEAAARRFGRCSVIDERLNFNSLLAQWLRIFNEFNPESRQYVVVYYVHVTYFP